MPRANRSFDELQRVFWSRVQKTDGCWPWIGKSRVPKGYGYISAGCLGLVHIYAHRLSWIIANGPVPSGMGVLHRCDNPACCNPAHLFLGTAGDNNRDCIAKGRKPLPRHSLPPEAVSHILALVAARPSIKAVARELGLPYGTVYHVATGRRRAVLHG